jgi:hypothetical protein
MAMILRALDRGGEVAGRTMLDGLLRDYIRTRAPWAPHWMTTAPGAIPEIIEIAKTRPLTREEVAEYLWVTKKRSTSRELATA